MTDIPKISPKIHPEWAKVLQNEFNADYFLDLKKFLEVERKHHTIFPPGPQIFNAFDHTPFSKVKAVILGQDPYHGEGQAHGLCFSVNRSAKIPPSLQNIYKELHADIGLPIPSHGNLTKWSDQGVLLLNATLTVRKGQPGSHQGKGWERLTDSVIKTISEERENIVFLLWGKYAQQKAVLVDHNKHLILLAPHPSPFSAHTGFFGCRHFSKANEFLISKGITPINWNPE